MIENINDSNNEPIEKKNISVQELWIGLSDSNDSDNIKILTELMCLID